MRITVHHAPPRQRALARRAAAQTLWSSRRRREAWFAPSVRNVDTTTGSLRVVRVEFRDHEAHAVAIIGDFNRWRPRAAPMVQVDRGRWMGILFLPPGRYEYLLEVDGRCVPDPHAQEVIPNVYGSENSVLIVPDCGDSQSNEVALVGDGPSSSVKR